MIELVIALIVITIAAIVMAMTIYKDISRRMAAVEQAWAETVSREHEKNRLIPLLEKAVQDYELHESFVHQQISALKSSLQQLSSDCVDAELLAVVEAQSRNLIKGVRIAVESYPRLKTSDFFRNWMNDITEQQKNIAAAIHHFNEAVEAFNFSIEAYPNSLINEQLNKKPRVKSYIDPDARSRFEYWSRAS